MQRPRRGQRREKRRERKRLIHSFPQSPSLLALLHSITQREMVAARHPWHSSASLSVFHSFLALFLITKHIREANKRRDIHFPFSHSLLQTHIHLASLTTASGAPDETSCVHAQAPAAFLQPSSSFLTASLPAYVCGCLHVCVWQ